MAEYFTLPLFPARNENVFGMALDAIVIGVLFFRKCRLIQLNFSSANPVL